MPVIVPRSDLRNYTSVTNEVKYGSRVYLTKNGRGHIVMIDNKELDDLEKELSLYKYKYEMAIAENPFARTARFLQMILRKKWAYEKNVNKDAPRSFPRCVLIRLYNDSLP